MQKALTRPNIGQTDLQEQPNETSVRLQRHSETITGHTEKQCSTSCRCIRKNEEDLSKLLRIERN